MPDAFYEPDGDRYVATELTRGPWDPGAQHAGPPAALLGREIERLPDAGEFQVGRVTFEILRSVPIAPVAVSARVVPPRPARAAGRGRAERRRRGADAGQRLAAPHRAGRAAGRGDGRRAAAARARAGRRSRVLPDRPGARLPHGDGGAASSPAASSSRARRRSGCGCASRWSPARSPRRCSGCWSPPTSATGSAPASTTAASSSSTSTSPSTSSGCRRASGSASTRVTLPQPSGVGTAESVLSDERGRIGRALQTLLVAQR